LVSFRSPASLTVTGSVRPLTSPSSAAWFGLVSFRSPASPTVTGSVRSLTSRSSAARSGREPGEYLYPDGTGSGHPEVFTLWMFVFDYPEHCDGPCGPDDMTNPAVEFGVYNPAGHGTAGSSLTLAGRAGVGDTAGAPPGIVPHDLSNPAGAEVHLAVSSHGQLDPATLPGEFRRPTGSGACGCWWVAIFD
jgi:hypothetical protein